MGGSCVAHDKDTAAIFSLIQRWLASWSGWTSTRWGSTQLAGGLLRFLWLSDGYYIICDLSPNGWNVWTIWATPNGRASMTMSRRRGALAENPFQ